MSVLMCLSWLEVCDAHQMQVNCHTDRLPHRCDFFFHTFDPAPLTFPLLDWCLCGVWGDQGSDLHTLGTRGGHGGRVWCVFLLSLSFLSLRKVGNSSNSRNSSAATDLAAYSDSVPYLWCNLDLTIFLCKLLFRWYTH